MSLAKSVIVVVAILGTGCSQPEIRSLSETLAENDSLVIVSFSSTYSLGREVDGEPYLIATTPNDPVAKGRILSAYRMSLALEDGETWTTLRTLPLHGSNYFGLANVIRVPAGSYELREWRIEAKNFYYRGVRMPLLSRGAMSNRLGKGISFVAKPKEILYLGQIQIDSRDSVVRADCRQRDLEFARTLFPELNGERVRYEYAGGTPCPE